MSDQYEVRVFTKQDPCNKSHLWECFRGRRGFIQVTLPRAWSIIGKNAPKNMLARGYVEILNTRRGEVYKLTPSGEDWLTKGYENYCKRHPQAAA